MRNWIGRSLLGAWMGLGFCAPVRAADAGCSLVRLASVDMALEQGGRISVPMTVNGKSLNMLVDTGGFLTMMNRSTAASLGLTEQRIADDMVGRGVGGLKLDHYVIASAIDFGGLKATNFRFAVLPATISNDADGAIGPDILTRYDAEFDFANARFNLFSPKHCPGQVVYWTHDPYAAIDLNLDKVGHIIVSVELDGKKQRAMIDTGSWRSAFSTETAQSDFSLKESDLKPLEGSSNANYRRYAFKTLTFQGITVNNPDIVLLSDSYAHLGSFGSPTMLLGAGILRQLHMYVAYSEKKLYVTPASAH